MITKISTSLKFLNKPIRVISSLLIALGMVFSSMPFVDFTVKAEDPTYFVVPTSIDDGHIGNTNAVIFQDKGETEIRGVLEYNGSIYTLYVFSTGSGCRFQLGTTGSRGGKNLSTQYQFHYYTSQSNASTESSYYKTAINAMVADGNYPIINVNSFSVADAYNATFGSDAVGPGPAISYGNIKDLAYSTKIAGGSVDQNLDYITWYPYWDTNNNVAINWDMEIRVVPGTYTSDTQNGLFALDPQNFVTNLGASVYVYQGAYSKGSIEVSWLRIKELLTPLQFATSGLFSFFDGEYWTKKGWMYQARYIDPDNNHTSEWQNIYTVTSSSGKGVEDVIDPSTETNLPDFYQNVNDSYNQIFNTTSTVNNNYNQVFYVNSAPYVVNPSEEPEEPDSETDRILEDILRVTIQIRQLIQQDQNDGDERDPEDTGLNDKDEELHDKEQELIDDMDDKLNDIDTDVDLLDTNGFLAAANWVRLQYDNLTLNTPFELVIVFALVLGIGLIFIGKVR